jgi:hypothetical protein
VTGFLATIIDIGFRLRQLDASTGASDPNDFTVRKCRARQSQPHVHRFLPLVCDDGLRPLVGQDGGSRKSDLPDGTSGIFSSERLDAWNHDEIVEEISASAQAKLTRP